MRSLEPRVCVVLLAGLAMASLLGCGMSATMDVVAKLRHTVSDYTDHLRWKRFSFAEAQCIPEKMAEFRAKRRRPNDEIVEVDVTGIDLARDKKRAVVHIVRRWYALPSTVIQSQTHSDVWEYRRGEWWWAGDAAVQTPSSARPRAR